MKHGQPPLTVGVHVRLRALRWSLLISQCRQDARWGEELRARGLVLSSRGVGGLWWCSERGWGAIGGGLGVLHGGRGFVQYG